MTISTQKWLLFSVTLALIASTAGSLTWLKAQQRLGAPGLKAVAIPNSVRLQFDLPENVQPFTTTNVPEAQEVLDTLPQDTSYAQRRYVAPDGFWVNANIILMGADRTSIHRPDYCLPGQGWQIGEKTEVKLPIAGSQPYELPVMKWSLRNQFTGADGQKQEVSGLYVFWFVTENQTTDSITAMQQSLLFHQLRHGVLQRWAYISYFAVCLPGQEEATFARMKQLITDSVPAFQLPPAAK
jgi:hypothetical protein